MKRAVEEAKFAAPALVVFVFGIVQVAVGSVWTMLVQSAALVTLRVAVWWAWRV